MTEFKKGDRVKVEFEGVVGLQDGCLVRVDYDAHSAAWIRENNVTLLGPALPTKPGSVIRSENFTFLLTTKGWYGHPDSYPWSSREAFENSMYAENFTVIYDADNPEGGK